MLGDVVVLGAVLCVPIPGLGVTDPVFWATAIPAARANTVDANKIFRIEACSLSDLLRLDSQAALGTRVHVPHLLSNVLFRCDAGAHVGDGIAELPALNFEAVDRPCLPVALFGPRWTNAVVCFYSSAGTVQ